MERRLNKMTIIGIGLIIMGIAVIFMDQKNKKN